MIRPSNQSYPNTKVSRLAHEDSRLLKSSSSLGAFHLVVQELVWNSIQASSKNIEVFIDKSKFLVMVKDDGHGIHQNDLQNSIGEWGHSSKIRDNKGQCLAAMVSIVDSLEVISRINAQSFVFSKKMSCDGQVIVSEVPSLRESMPSSGTIVIAYNVFATLPVRQKCIRWEYEFAKVKDWIMRTSVLHHSINFTITDLSQNRVVSNIISSTSVMQSLLSQFGFSIANKVCHVDVSFHGYRMVGFISQPKHDCCLSNKDQQLLFVHGQLIERCESITSLLNKAFTRYLATQNRTGFNSRHMDLQAESNLKFPIFVLQVFCPGPEDYDVLVEPSKSTVFFRQPTEIEQLALVLLRQLQQAFPNFQPVVDSLIQQNTHSNVLSSSEHSDLQQSPAIRQRLLQQKLYKHSVSGSQQVNAQELLDDAFELKSSPMKNSNKVVGKAYLLASPPSCSSLRNDQYECEPSSSHTKPAMSRIVNDGEKIESIGVTVQRFPPSTENHSRSKFPQADTMDMTARKKSQPERIYEQTGKEPLQFENTQETPKSDIDDAGSDPEETIGEFLLQSEDCLGQYLRHGQVPISDTFSVDTKEKAIAVPTIRHIEHSPDRLIKRDPLRKKRPLAEVASTIVDHEIDNEGNPFKQNRLLPVNPHTDSVSLQRDAIVSGNLQCIGQVDRKYVACCLTQTLMDNPASNQRQLLALLDQHAIDERVQLECLQQSIISSPMPASCDRRTILLSPPERLNVDWSTMQILREKEKLFENWCFTYHLLPDSLYSSTAVDGNQESPYSLDLVSVPMVCGDEVLIAEDFIEFCVFLHMHREIPDSLQAPPAVHRILTSKACRSALKFGQVLQRREMESLLTRWQETKVPFQCAHGRPSVVPMVDLSPLVQMVATQEARIADTPQFADLLAALMSPK